ncbi:ABC transporter ATP-binding protein [Streptococcus zalophi]|uniref:ABC transporter ATP-binding protein n=1 Tax=Streptococcus zalophi TaxID=640031 RepID=UPI00215C708E|nr:ABC transporter ATP-binding protein [Streptococcus zalophi]MCR8967724.1 ABC transporter ATP-binding protein [Streptococcus zalophi]
MPLLEIIGLNKSYHKKRVVSDLSLELHSGEIMGLIGQNGSGKTTIFKAILGLVKKDSGLIKINGKSIEENSKKYLNTIGTIIEYPTFYESLTASQNLMLFSSLYDDINVSKADVLKYLHWVGLENDVNSKVSSFSLGMKQRLGLAQALIHKPTILLLDEPFNGLDPRGMKDFRELLSQLSQDGVGIIISSHSLEELNKLVDTVTIINQGQVIFQGQKSEFLSLGSRNNMWLLKTDNKEITRSILNQLAINFSEKDELFELSLSIEKTEDMKEKLLKNLLQQSVSIINFSQKQDNFEDIFLNMQTDTEVEYD